jgi:uncharacterized protein with PQ loop repeat
MSAIELLTFMYGMVGIISLVGYLPQILELIRNKTCTSVSIKSWLIWTYTSLVSTGYAFFAISDTALQFVTSVNAMGCIVVLTLAIYRKSQTEIQVFAKG